MSEHPPAGEPVYWKYLLKFVSFVFDGSMTSDMQCMQCKAGIQPVMFVSLMWLSSFSGNLHYLHEVTERTWSVRRCAVPASLAPQGRLHALCAPPAWAHGFSRMVAVFGAHGWYGSQSRFCDP